MRPGCSPGAETYQLLSGSEFNVGKPAVVGYVKSMVHEQRLTLQSKIGLQAVYTVRIEVIDDFLALVLTISLMLAESGSFIICTICKDQRLNSDSMFHVVVGYTPLPAGYRTCQCHSVSCMYDARRLALPCS